MADILIRGMEMPKTCQICRTAKFDRIVGCEEWDRLSIAQRMYMRSETCPLIPLPKGHGRLIDADALMEIIKAHDYPLRAHFNSTDNGMFTLGIQQAVDEAPTIVPAEGGGEE